MSPGNIGDMMRAAKSLKKQRKRLGLTQQELAEALGVQQGHIAHLEAGRRQPSLELASLIEELVGIEASSWARGS